MINDSSGKIYYALVNKIKPKHIIVCYCGYILICLIAIVLFDVFNVAGVRSYMEALDIYHPRVWYQIFGEQGPTEMLQWFVLGLVTLTSVFIAGQLIEQKKLRLGFFWFLIGTLSIVLLMEDGANISHRFKEYMSYLFPDSILSSRKVIYLIYMIIALVPIIKYWKDLYHYRTSFKYLLLGYIFYGIAGFQSVFLGVLGISRAPLGNYIINNLFNGALYYSDPRFPSAIIGYRFMDTVFEESIELFAVCLLLSSILTFIQAETQIQRINGLDF